MSDTSIHLADQALSNLVDQFARPLDFLRELAQNSIDAGTPRIEISVAFEPDKDDPGRGVLQVHVDDFGEGMDEEIIDNQLTRLFSSTKEDDLTKIGKFGIGFTSIFAIRPEAVLLRTGRHGEYWELLFHADRSFDKVKITDPVAGTKLTLYKRMPADEVERFTAEARFVLGYWCEHSDVPITWWDKTKGEAAPVPETADPFAAFESPEGAVGPEPVNRPLSLEDSALQIRLVEGETEIVAGFCDPPRYGYYNGGLTLLASRSTDCLGSFESDLSHISFKVKNDRLEHTLTRDNVLHDDHWEVVMGIVEKARAQLVETLLDRLEEAVVDPSRPPLDGWHQWLARECLARNENERTAGLLERNLFRDHAGNPITLSKVRAQEKTLGFVLLASGSDRLDTAVAGSGVHLLPDGDTVRELLFAAVEPSLFYLTESSRTLRRADEAFVMPEVIDGKHLTAEERVVIERTEHLIRHAMGLRLPVPLMNRVMSWSPTVNSAANRIDVKVGDFGGVDLGTDDVLALNGPANKGVFVRPEQTWSVLPSFLRWRTLLVNRNHPLFRTQVLAAGDDLEVAALGLAQALLTAEDMEPERSHRWLLEGTLDEWGIGGQAK